MKHALLMILYLTHTLTYVLLVFCWRIVYSRAVRDVKLARGGRNSAVTRFPIPCCNFSELSFLTSHHTLDIQMSEKTAGSAAGNATAASPSSSASSAGSANGSGTTAKKPLPEQNPAFRMMGMQLSNYAPAHLLTNPRLASPTASVSQLDDLLDHYWRLRGNCDLRQMADETNARKVV